MTTNKQIGINPEELREYLMKMIDLRIKWINVEKGCNKSICNIEEQLAKIDAEIQILDHYCQISDKEIETIYQRF